MRDGSGGYLLALLTDSFVVRASVGTLAAVLLSLLAIRLVPVKSRVGRRLLVLAPVVAAAAAAVASLGGQFLPTILVMNAVERGGLTGTDVLDLLAESGDVTQGRSIGLLLAGYGVVAVLLLSRRLLGAVRVHALLRGAPSPDDDRTSALLERLSQAIGVRNPRLRLVERCPGGAFSAGFFRPVIAVDPVLLSLLDDRELEGLLAHELAHLRRVDPATGLVVGVLRDLAFFLPGVHIAAHWLSMEQEESADELAASVTGRPAALASGLLKVWHAHGLTRGGMRGAATSLSVAACAAGGNIAFAARWPKHRILAWGTAAGAGGSRPVVTLSSRWSVARLVPAGIAPWPVSDGVAVITRRVQRLIESLPVISSRRRTIETVLGVTVTLLAVVAALAAPAWLSRRHADLLGVFYVSNQATTSVESPAFATFHALAADPARDAGPVATASTQGADGGGAIAESGSGLHDLSTEAATCPCIASPTQLALRQGASPAERPATVWGTPAWTLQHLRNQADLQATRRLVLMDGADQQVGILTAGHRSSTPRASGGVLR